MQTLSLREKQSLFAFNISKLIEYIYSLNMSVTFGEAYRTPEQARLDAQEGIGIINSLHCVRLAIDLNLFDAQGNYIATMCPDYQKIGDYWKSLNSENNWGGDFKRIDLNHFEMVE